MSERIEHLIKELWSQTDCRLKDTSPLGRSVPTIEAMANERNNRDSISGLAPWLVAFDECVSWLVSVAITLREALHASETPRKELRVYTMLSATMVSQYLSIRRLVLAGFDISARQLLRCLVEYKDVAALLHERPELIEEFFNTQDEQQSNAFWHKHVAKGKARKILDERLTSIAGLGENDSFLEWKRGTDAMLSMTVHPSYLASVMATFPPGSDALDNWPGMFGLKAEVSITTLSDSILTLIDFAFFWWDVPFPHFAHPNPLVAFDEKNDWHVRARYGREVVLGLIDHLLRMREEGDLRPTRGLYGESFEDMEKWDGVD